MCAPRSLFLHDWHPPRNPLSTIIWVLLDQKSIQMKRLCQDSLLDIFCTYGQQKSMWTRSFKIVMYVFFCKCLSLHQSLQQKERKHSGWAALVVKAVAKKGSLLTHSSTEVPEQVILSSHYESNYSESESGQILSSNICIWNNRAGKKWGERYTFWYIVLLTILERRKSIVQCIPTCNLT